MVVIFPNSKSDNKSIFKFNIHTVHCQVRKLKNCQAYEAQQANIEVPVTPYLQIILNTLKKKSC